MTGRVVKLESLGTVDGPGVRSVVFLAGCPLRCACCHNPETWDPCGGESISADALAERLLRYRPYFGENGGVTVSGGEPLMQAEFVAELFSILHFHGVHTALDTSGCFPVTDEIKRLLSLTDLVLLDIKYTDNEAYRRYAGCTLDTVLDFLSYLDQAEIPIWIRQVLIPGLNDRNEDLDALAFLLRDVKSVEKAELLAFRKLCLEKYRELGIPFPLADTAEPSSEHLAERQRFLQERIAQHRLAH
jgi:pyruvate formate lyase activating enzyme